MICKMQITGARWKETRLYWKIPCFYKTPNHHHYQSFQWCQDNGGYLAEFGTVAEQNAGMQLVDTQSAWIGGHSPSFDNDFRWLSNNDAVSDIRMIA